MPEAVYHNETLRSVRRQASAQQLRITVHAHREMVEEGISLAEVLQAIAVSTILEDYPDHQRGGMLSLGRLY